MLNECMVDIADIRRCCDCFLNRDRPNSVELVCSKPHLLLWVCYDNYPWWPAKLLEVGNGICPLEVEFFGESSGASVTYTDCLLYSHADPNIWFNDRKNEEFCRAMQVNITRFYIFCFY